MLCCRAAEYTGGGGLHRLYRLHRFSRKTPFFPQSTISTPVTTGLGYFSGESMQSMQSIQGKGNLNLNLTARSKMIYARIYARWAAIYAILSVSKYFVGCRWGGGWAVIYAIYATIYAICATIYARWGWVIAKRGECVLFLPPAAVYQVCLG